MTRSRLIVAGGVVLAAAALVSGLPNPNSVVIPETGQTLTCSITSPIDGAMVPMPPGTVQVEGGAVVGDVATQQINVLYVLDVSGSTDGNHTVDADGNGMVDDGDHFGSGGDNYNALSGDTESGEILDGEISGVLALHASIGNPSNVAVGVIAFATSASNADVGPAVGEQFFVSPPQADGGGLAVSDIEEVVRNLRSGDGPGGEIKAFNSPVVNVGNNTNFQAALAEVNATLANFPAGQNIVFFLSDGMSNTPGQCFAIDPMTGNPFCATELADAQAAGTIIHTVGVGAGADPMDLQYIADQTGGSFTLVTDPSDLATELPNIQPAGIDHIDVNGMSVPLDPLGNFSVEQMCPAEGFFTITATCVADDVDSTSISTDVTVSCVQILCGNGMSDPGEECEPPNGPICDANCQRIPVCGDSFIDAPETCDDGNVLAGDCCSPTCQPEPQGSPCTDDGNPCTDTACNNAAMCVATPKPDGYICNDNDVCTLNDHCQAGQCTGGSGADQDGDGDCDLKEQQCGCSFSDAKEVCLLPNRLVGKAGNGRGEVLMNWYAPTLVKPPIDTDPSCQQVGDCINSRCVAGGIYDKCTTDSDCNLPPDTCRVVVNWAGSPDMTLLYAKMGRTLIGGFTPITPGCSRKVDVAIDPIKRSSVLKLKTRGTADGRYVVDRDGFRYRRY
jgi:cysteine-rich repeat protein